jgi:hypothetical protein
MLIYQECNDKLKNANTKPNRNILSVESCDYGFIYLNIVKEDICMGYEDAHFMVCETTVVDCSDCGCSEPKSSTR